MKLNSGKAIAMGTGLLVMSQLCAVRAEALPEEKVNLAPSITLVQPASGLKFLTTQNITVSAEAGDDHSVRVVEFFDNGKLIGTATGAPYSIDLQLPAGSHAISAKAKDGAGLVTSSSVSKIAVETPNLPPTVRLTSEQDGMIIPEPGSVTLHAQASDVDGSVLQVDFFNGESPIGTAVTNPYDLTVTGLAAGEYSFTAVAADNSGNKTTSAPVQVTVASSKLRITSLVLDSGVVQIGIAGPSGISVVLQSMEDRSSWSDVETKTLTSTGGTIFKAPTDVAKRAFRLKLKQA